MSFDQHDSSYKSLKAVLEGGVEGRPANVVLYATSNRRHLMRRDMIENEGSTAINPRWPSRSASRCRIASAVARFSQAWSGHHEIVRGYAERYWLDLPLEQLKAEAVKWSITRRSRSGQVAWQFIQDLAGQLGKPLG